MFIPLLSTLVATLATSTIFGAAAPAAPPEFELLFSGTFQMGDVETLEGPFGTRLHAVVTGANFTDPSGKLVGTLLPTADTGIISNSGIFFPEAVLPIRWEVDGKMAYLRANGVGSSFTDLSFLHAETHSKTWSGLNSRFLVANLTFPAGQTNTPIFNLFGAL